MGYVSLRVVFVGSPLLDLRLYCGKQGNPAIVGI